MREVVFVFGSNLAGRHGKGAALEAAQNWGAEYGVGEGRTGSSYALPTKDENIKTLPLEDIKNAFSRFWEYVGDHPEIQFLLTPVGTGLAGYSLSQIKTLAFTEAHIPRNVWLTGDWFETQKGRSIPSGNTLSTSSIKDR